MLDIPRTMKVLYVFLLFNICSVYAEQSKWSSLISKYSADLLRLTSFFSLPRTMADALEENWSQPEETKQETHLTTLCRKDDPSICLLFDKQGSIAAYQISIPKQTDTLNMTGIDYTESGFKTISLFGNNVYSITVYFDSQDSILKGGRSSTPEPETANDLWIPLKGKGLVKVPRNEKNLDQIPMYKKQHCFPKMSTHWFYNMSKSLEPRSFYPIFLLYDQGDLIGFGFTAFGGKIIEKSLKDYIPLVARRNWFEKYLSGAMKNIAHDAPDWMDEYAEKYGAFTHHVFFVEKPWQLECY